MDTKVSLGTWGSAEPGVAWFLVSAEVRVVQAATTENLGQGRQELRYSRSWLWRGGGAGSSWGCCVSCETFEGSACVW